MLNILILGAAGDIARVATQLFLEQTDARLTLFLRGARRLKQTTLRVFASSNSIR